MKLPSFEKLAQIVAGKGYKVFDNDSKPFNLNIVGIRSTENVLNTFNDHEYVFWKHKGVWQGIIMEVTTDPGSFYRKTPMNQSGTAIMLPGQYPGLWQLGLHKGMYTALVQVGKVKVARDSDKDDLLEIDPKKIEEGVFGINNHRAVEKGRSIMVDKWSAGCVVVADYYQYEIYMRLVTESVKNWTDSFTFTLLEQKDIETQ